MHHSVQKQGDCILDLIQGTLLFTESNIDKATADGCLIFI